MSYLLDTNVISEVRKKERSDRNVYRWWSGVRDSELHLSVLVLGEIRKGIEGVRGKDPRQAEALERWLQAVNAFFQPFPGVDADRLVRVFGVEDDDAYQNVPYLDFLDYAAPSSALEDTAFEGFAAAQPYKIAAVRLEAMTVDPTVSLRHE